ncbi:hypothetical protein OVS_01140 [Mycoplasma ovis str. Michigan]|uniref:ABC transporter domain-containing protein n=1 Tax=Mycoplasma ovis str. Michigan TaxID=1415773 RepID=A0ABM5P164_9MOLU|nr:ABC transporter ATP-binding protein [Mycoplasma ovis]AHC40183.1 hypothetical protein OVS_01140 [Mycoplasma ovis str. Michigan]
MKFLTLSICSLGCITSGIGLNQITQQIQSNFQTLKQDEFMKTTSPSDFSSWNLIYSSGSLSYLRKTISQIQLMPEPTLAKIDSQAQNSGSMITSSLAYLPKLKNLLNSFFKDLDWKTLIEPETINSGEQEQQQQIYQHFAPFKEKFFSFNNWIEIGIFGLIIESIFTISLIASIFFIFLDRKLNKKEKIKWILFYSITNIFGWAYLRFLRVKLLRLAGKQIYKPQIQNKSNSYQFLSSDNSKSEIVLSNLSFSKADYKILKNINLKLKKGEFYSIIGPNGAGKTTLLKNIGGILESSSGKVQVGGKPIQLIPRKSLWQRVVYIPQELEIQPDTPIYDFLLYSRFIFLKRTQKATAEDHLKVLEAMKKCGLEDFRYSRMGELSGGQRQKVILASIMIKEAEIILLDEPTTHLDIENKIFLISFFKELKDSKKIVIANLHNFAEISQLSSQIIAIKNGILQKFSKTGKVLKPKFLNELYDLDLSESKWERILNSSLIGY